MRGNKRSLTEYLELFPHNEVAVAEDYVAFEKDWSESGSEIPFSPRDTSTRNNQVIGDYRLLKEIGRGGQGRVYLAKDTKLRRRVAIKLLENCGDSQDLAFARYRREIEALSTVDHPGICPVYDGGILDGQAYIAMRLVEGKSLRDILRPATPLESGEESEFYSLSSGDLATDDAPLTVDKKKPRILPKARCEIMEFLQLIEKTARALHAAHEAGIAHGDIKPANIMVENTGRPILLDFGLAGSAEDDVAVLTRVVGLHGTPAYMAPELIKSKKANSNRATDIYALGVTLFECLTGSRPFMAQNRQALYHAILETEAPSASDLNPSISQELSVVIKTALRKEPSKRYKSALDFAEDLRRIREFEPILARPATRWTKSSRWCRRNPGLAASLSAVFLLLVLSLGLATQFLKQEESQRLQLAGMVSNLKIETNQKEAAIAALERERRAKEAFFDLAIDLLNKTMGSVADQPEMNLGQMIGNALKTQLVKAKRAITPPFQTKGHRNSEMDLIIPRGKTTNVRPEFEFRIPKGMTNPKNVLLTLEDKQKNRETMPVQEFTVKNRRVKFAFPWQEPLRPGQAYHWSIVVDGKKQSPLVLRDGTIVDQEAKFFVAHRHSAGTERVAKLDTAAKRIDAKMRHAQRCIQESMATDAIKILENLPPLKTRRQKRMKTFLLGRAYASVGDREKIETLKETNP